MAQVSAAAFFLEKWLEMVDGKKNSKAMSLDKYNANVLDLQSAISNPGTKSSHQQNLLKSFMLVPAINGTMKLIRRRKSEEDNFLYVVANEQLYETISKEHLSLGHAGITKMMHLTRSKYYNVTQEAVTLFISLCEECERKRKKASSKGIVVKPIRSSKAFERMQVDLIDMQGDPDGENNWILNAQDHKTKFVQLRPIKRKTAEEVANALLEIFLTTNGAPAILQSDNGREFDNALIQDMEKQWSGLRIVHGRPRHPQSQGSVERSNAEVSKLLSIWRTHNGGREASWANGLKFVQFQMNRSRNSGIKMSPCEALYGDSASVGLATTCLPPSNLEVESIINEDDFDAMCAGEYTSSSSVPPISHEDTPASISSEGNSLQEAESEPSCLQSAELESACPSLQQAELSCLQDADPESASPSLQEDGEVHVTMDDSYELSLGSCGSCSKGLMESAMVCVGCRLAIHQECGYNGMCTLCRLSNERTKKRKIVSEAQEQQAQKMLKRSEAYRPQLHVGDNVRIGIPKVDRPRLDPPNVIGVVTAVDEHGGYRVGTKHGQVKGVLARNMIEKCSQNVFISPDQVPDTVLSVRQTNTHGSTGHGQGHFHCNCKTGCQNGRCKCKKSNKVCNSRCHTNLGCKNKG